MAIKDYNTDPDLNTTISGINIAEGCPPSGINNAIRQLMADVKEEKETRDAEQAVKDAEQAVKDAEQDAAIKSKISTVNGFPPDSNGNVDVGGMPLGMPFPYTGKDVPAGTLRADGSTYTNMQASFPDFYEWVKNSGLTVPLADYALVEGSCGYYGLDTSTGTVRMPTLAAGVFGADAAGQYGQAVQAGLPNITASGFYAVSGLTNGLQGAFAQSPRQTDTAYSSGYNPQYYVNFNASDSNPIYGRSDTVTPAHVKYPWVIVVYNAAVPPSVAQAGEFVDLLDGKADKMQVANAEAINAEGRARIVGWGMPDYSAGVAVANLVTINTAWTAPSDGILTAHIRVSGAQSRAALNINGTTTGHITNNSSGYVENGVSMTVPVSKGDVVKLVSVTGTNTVLNGSTVTFYPLKGA